MLNRTGYDIQYGINFVFYFAQIIGYVDQLLDLLNHTNIGPGELWPIVATCQWEMDTYLPSVVQMLQVMQTIGKATNPGSVKQRFTSIVLGTGCSERNWYQIGLACNTAFAYCSGNNLPYGSSWLLNMEDPGKW